MDIQQEKNKSHPDHPQLGRIGEGGRHKSKKIQDGTIKIAKNIDSHDNR